MRHELGEDGSEVLPRCKGVAEGIHRIVQRPARHYRIEGENEHTGNHAHITGHDPGFAWSKYAIGTHRIGPAAAAHNKLTNHYRHSQQEYEQQIYEDEGRPAVHPGHIGEAPDVSQSHR